MECGNADRDGATQVGHMGADCTRLQDVRALFGVSQVLPRKSPEFGNLLHSGSRLNIQGMLRLCRFKRQIDPFRWRGSYRS
jgi:hypothetical protein